MKVVPCPEVFAGSPAGRQRGGTAAQPGQGAAFLRCRAGGWCPAAPPAPPTTAPRRRLGTKEKQPGSVAVRFGRRGCSVTAPTRRRGTAGHHGRAHPAPAALGTFRLSPVCQRAASGVSVTLRLYVGSFRAGGLSRLSGVTQSIWERVRPSAPGPRSGAAGG